MAKKAIILIIVLVVVGMAGTIGGLVFAIGMCMCLLPEWNLFTTGVVTAIIGFIMLFKYRNNEKDTPNEEYNVPMHCFFSMGTVFVIIFSVVNLIMVLLANG